MTVLYKAGDSDTRPWGTWEVLAVGEGYIVKRIMVLPHKKLSLQSHHFRSEHWIMVAGEGQVTLGEETKTVSANEAVFIEKEQKHRMENASDESLTFIEVQTGDTLDESDIVRYQDDYGRS